MVRIPEGPIFFFQYLISFSFWSMAKQLEYPNATQEVVGSNPRRVTYFFKILINFLFGIRAKPGSPSSILYMPFFVFGLQFM